MDIGQSLWYLRKVEFWKPGGELGTGTIKVVQLSDFQWYYHCQIQCDAKATTVLVWTHEAVVCDTVAYVPQLNLSLPRVDNSIANSFQYPSIN